MTKVGGSDGVRTQPPVVEQSNAQPGGAAASASAQVSQADPTRAVDFTRQAAGRQVTDPGIDNRPTAAFQASAGAQSAAAAGNTWALLGGLECYAELDNDSKKALCTTLECVDPQRQDAAKEALRAWDALFMTPTRVG